jgi:ribosome-binding protein aMBF1 (putative translation factor)
MKDIITEAEDRGLSRADIAIIAKVDPSTVRNWWKTGNGSLTIAREFLRKLYGIESIKSIDQSTQTQKEEKVTEIVLSVNEQRLGIITISTGVLKNILKD